MYRCRLFTNHKIYNIFQHIAGEFRNDDWKKIIFNLIYLIGFKHVLFSFFILYMQYILVSDIAITLSFINFAKVMRVWYLIIEHFLTLEYVLGSKNNTKKSVT
jgi:hypothetical protein